MAFIDSLAGFIIKTDVLVNSGAASLHKPALTTIMLAITNLASPLSMIILSAVAFLLLAYKKRWQSTILLVASMLGGLVLELLFKLIIHRLRPENALYNVASYSFPSGHATIAIIYFPLLIYLFKDKIKSKHLQSLFVVVNIALTILIGFSRIYLNVHWLSDVIAGYALGWLWLSLLIYIFQLKKTASKHNKTA